MEFSANSLYHEIIIRDNVRRFGKKRGLKKALIQIRSIGKGWDGATWRAIKAYKPGMTKKRKVRSKR